MRHTQRIAGLLALAALIGGPFAGIVCAMRCAPNQALNAIDARDTRSPRSAAPSATTASAAAAVAASASTSPSAHHQGHHHAATSSSSHASPTCCRPTTTRVVASIGQTGCDTHGTPDRDLLATLTAALRSDTHNPIALPATLFDRVALTLASATYASPAHGPPLDTSRTLRSLSLVLRV